MKPELDDGFDSWTTGSFEGLVLLEELGLVVELLDLLVFVDFLIEELAIVVFSSAAFLAVSSWLAFS